MWEIALGNALGGYSLREIHSLIAQLRRNGEFAKAGREWSAPTRLAKSSTVLRMSPQGHHCQEMLAFLRKGDRPALRYRTRTRRQCSEHDGRAFLQEIEEGGMRRDRALRKVGSRRPRS